MGLLEIVGIVLAVWAVSKLLGGLIRVVQAAVIGVGALWALQHARVVRPQDVGGVDLTRWDWRGTLAWLQEAAQQLWQMVSEVVRQFT